MTRYILAILLVAPATWLHQVDARAQSATDIWLFSLDESEVSPVARLTNRHGYDNQPSFTEDGQQLLFTSDRTGRADTHVYDLLSGEITRLTFSDADKYSPTIVPGTRGEDFSVVHSDSVVMQGLWRYPLDGMARPQAVADIDSVAYFAWMDPAQVLLWRLSTPPTVVVLNTESDKTTVLAQDSAFSFKAHPSGTSTAYLARWSGKHSEIRSIDNESLESIVLAPTVGNGRDFAIAPDGRLLMMNGGELYARRPALDDEWTRIADLGIQRGSRIAVSPDGSLIAVVGEH